MNPLSRLRRAVTSEAGSATVEFVCVFPFFIFVFLSAFEIALMNIRAVSLERATDITVRAIRLNDGGIRTESDVDGDGDIDDDDQKIRYEAVLKAICDRVFAIRDCPTSVTIELRSVSKDTWNLPPDGAICSKMDGTINPSTSYSNGVENELMMVRVCAIVDPIFPNYGFGRSMPKWGDKGYAIIATSAFVNEPN